MEKYTKFNVVAGDGYLRTACSYCGHSAGKFRLDHTDSDGTKVYKAKCNKYGNTNIVKLNKHNMIGNNNED